MQERVKYPIGIQTFEEIITQSYLYVDKTALVYKLTSNCKYAFLSRPRRFGKSLLVSTLQAYFEGRKELFKGLAMETLETEWTQRPVLRFDMSTAKHCDVRRLESELNVKLLGYEALYGKGEGEEEPNQRLMGLIQRAYAKTGQKVVVLIDEYDAPLLDVVHEEVNLTSLRQVMRNFYSPLKYCDPYLHFVFLTGITKFSQLSIFSELNNIKNVSMQKDYAAICGITEEEMLSFMNEGIEALAQEQGITKEKAIKALKSNYDGYHFTWPSPDIYNPFSLLNALNDRKIDSYWFGSGTPTYLIEMLRKYDISPSRLNTAFDAAASDFDAPTERMTNITPLLYQSGYVTIKGYDSDTELYALGLPNREVQVGLLKSLLSHYLSRIAQLGNTTIGYMFKALLNDNLNDFFEILEKFLYSVEYTNDSSSEGQFQKILYVIFALLGARIGAEIHSNNGRMDLVMTMPHRIYIFELKLNRSAEAALKQIDDKNYAARFAITGLPVVKVGANFDSEKKNLTDWLIVE